MDQFPDGTKFKYPWRTYQKRVLEELGSHLNDDHLHIVAPPGSGKTVLGLEVALQLNKPTLIFAPTLAIRNQWIQRFCELFLQSENVPDWISNDIKNPRFLTVITYQSLHAALTKTEEVEAAEEESATKATEEIEEQAEDTNEIILSLKLAQFGTMVVDEAHHLKNAWWNSLDTIKTALEVTVVGLTATPPYDVTPKEWQRYIDLNGPVDAEISIPELVAEGDLCPHQDFIYLSRPTAAESKIIGEHRAKARAIFEEIKTDKNFIGQLERLPIYLAPQENLNLIYENISFYSSILIFLNGVGKKIHLDHLEVIGDKKFTIPLLTYDWLEVILNNYLFNREEQYAFDASHQHFLMNKLRKHGLLSGKAVRFIQNDAISRALSASSNKLKSIEQIVDFEANKLQNKLRMVVLTDYIRKSYLVKSSENDLPLKQIGVIPIFEQLRRNNLLKAKLAVLTGSVIILPKSAREALYKACLLVAEKPPKIESLTYDDSYILVNPTGALKNRIVSIITRIFQSGEVEVLIGTKALLGEGWDAPAINALILASFVGSFVQSNQMRGRAIRTNPNDKNKTSNIWHLVCLDPLSPYGGEDIDLLRRRFKGFVGLSFGQEVMIQNGIERLNMPKTFEPAEHQEATTESEINSIMMTHASNREMLLDRWLEALKAGKVLVEEMKIPYPKGQDYWVKKKLYYTKTVAYLIGIFISAIAGFGLETFLSFIKSAKSIKSMETFFYWLTYVGITAIILFGSLAYKTLRIYIKHRDIAKDIAKIGEALVDSLINVGIITSERSKLAVISSMDFDGAVYCHLEGGSTFEKSTFIKCLQEIIDYIENPRYIIVRKSFFIKLIAQRDYHAVPEELGRKKATANYFKMLWSQKVGRCNLVYTRTLKGRKFLLKARMQSLASVFENDIVRFKKWQ